MTLKSIAAVGILATIGFLIVGCAGPEADQTAADPKPDSPAEITHDHASHDHGDQAEHSDGDAMAKMKAGLAKLSDDDRAAAEKQHMCPVSDHMLGTMGAPVKLTLNDQDVWICCEGCR